MRSKRTPGRWHAWTRRVEIGSMEGGTFGEITYMPFLIGLLLVGLIFALVGYWRVGASYATQYGAQVGSVSPESGDDVMSAVWQGWAHNALPAGSYTVDEGDRSVRTSMSRSTTFDFYGFGPWEFSIAASGGSHVSIEQFTPGDPRCGGGGCDD